MSSPDVLALAAFVEPLPPVLADRFQHREPWLGSSSGALAHEAFIEQRSQAIEQRAPQVLWRIADSLDRFQGASSDEDGKSAEEHLLGSRQQIVTPVNGLP